MLLRAILGVVLVSGAIATAIPLATRTVDVADPIVVPADNQLAGHQGLGMLQYVSGDYALAVSDAGEIMDVAEYHEQIELLERVGDVLSQSPPGATAGRIAALSQSLAQVMQHVRERQPPSEVRAATAALRADWIGAYGLRLAPESLPSLHAGRRVYAEACAICHGADGRSRTAAAQHLEPAPSDFHDPRLQETLSPYQAFNVVTFGVEGTGMPAFPTLTEEERWAVAFYALSLRHTGGGDDFPVPTSPALELLAGWTDAELAGWLLQQGVPKAALANAVATLRVVDPQPN